MTSPPTISSPSEALRENAEAHLRALAGPDAKLRDDQWTAIGALVEQRRRVVVVQRTGWGKSAVYWVATALRRAAGGGPTLVVSPLLALMRDQVAAAGRAGLAAATLNSSNADDWPAIEALVADDTIDVLLISPERLNSIGFRSRVLPRLAGRLGMLVVDEAHCISDWGHDFRPDYRRIATVLAELPAGTPVLATTATANARVSADVAAQLGHDTLTLRGSLDREGLALAVVPSPAGGSAAHAYAWVADFLASTSGSGIIYTLTVAETQRLAEFLKAAGHEVAAYSSATDPAERERLEAALLAGRLRGLVATSSLGMGYDHPRLSFVVHVGAPSSPVAYYQQVGRAGRALDHAVGVLLPTAADERIWAYFDSTAFPAEPVVRRVLDVLASAANGGDGVVSVPRLEVDAGLRRGRLEALLKVLDVDGAVERASGGWRSTGAAWHYDAERIAGIAAARRAEQQVMRAYAGAGGECLLKVLRAELDDPGARDCGRCSVCTGSLPAPGAVAAEDTLAAARTHLRSQTTVVEPRKMWPTGAARRGRIAEGQRAEPGRALALAQDPAWGEAVAAALARDAPVGDEVFDGLVRTLARWGWPAGRPTWITAMPSARHGALLADLASRLGALGRMEVRDALAERPTRSEAGGANPTSAASADAALASIAPVADDLPTGPVLLVDAVRRSGWRLTVAAALLREAGAGPVYPLVVHQDASA